ncbi:MAG TPA: ATPase domain-containing protein [Candidatus Angelobacter sp.]|nr:ATPase domain-containing protein [Candidatus Angelobacter sp.]
MPEKTAARHLRTGNSGLDNILHGGLQSGHVYLVEGDPGSGKTTLGLQFLLEGMARGERTLYITLAESRDELEGVAASHGFDISSMELFEVQPPELDGSGSDQYTVFHPSEVELVDVMQNILSRVEKTKAERIVFDSMSEIRMLARDPLRYRRQILTLKQFFVGRKCTVLLLDDRTGSADDMQLQSICHGAIRMESIQQPYGPQRRQIQVLKMRASRFREGQHDYKIARGGIQVFPRLISAEHHPEDVDRNQLPSGIGELDKLFGGGVGRGTTSLFLGPAGSGKSTLATKFLFSGAIRGERGVMFTSDETLESVRTRCSGLGIPLETHLDDKTIQLKKIQPAGLSPGEFTAYIRSEVEQNSCRIVIIDSINGLLTAMQEQTMMVQLHELFSYLNHMGATTFVVMAQFGVLGVQMGSPLDISYLADNVLLFRYFEAKGSVRQAISVVKRRSGPHERSIRELRLASQLIEIGPPLHDFEGILTGVPKFVGSGTPLL